ncbi:tripartite ATP-independent transporter DctM subunit [Tamilnaduibacter salinus]|uniref:TRAP transporter large permease protein n=1 Tax=Tamilnaduibacter salinus TaxID=1484056 RepID=A0A2A2I3A2_9GAMM|nr:TRAP transporter large permease subunit [Tamilnaduibacter salinus]PAV25605.1 C4-dicarboxylate ABC transporter [Tamilnaduibacter salinus]PVY78090.1 tripartite ATP-independent transporter DctM subunit [Tamilnaduibacter salinus]
MPINEMLAIGMFVLFILLIFTGFPIAWVLGGIALAFTGLAMLSDMYLDTFIAMDWGYFSLSVERIWGTMSSWVLVAIPMFVFMGQMLDRSGIAEKLMLNVSRLFGRLNGGIAIAVVIIGLLLAASTGIVGASVALLTLLAVPVMLKRDYNPDLAVGTVCAVGTLGILMPPSIMLVMMADQLAMSVGDLFMGAVFPSALLGVAFVIYIVVRGWFQPSAAPAGDDAEPVTFGVVFDAFKSILPPAMLILAVLGSIFAGLATPTEASGVGAFGATLLALSNRRLSLSVLKDVCRETSQTTAFIFALLVGATAFSLVLRGLGGDGMIEELLSSLPFGPAGIVICILLITFLLGFVLDWIEITLIMLPLVAPVVQSLGFDLVWFTVLFAVCLQTSFLTPPVGFSLFYCKGVAPPSITVGTLYRGVLPFILLQASVLTLIFLWPELVTWLPDQAYTGH